MKNIPKKNKVILCPIHSLLTQFALVKSRCNASWIKYIIQKEASYMVSREQKEEKRPEISIFLSRPYAMTSLPLTGSPKCLPVLSHFQKLNTKSFQVTFE